MYNEDKKVKRKRNTRKVRKRSFFNSNVDSSSEFMSDLERLFNKIMLSQIFSSICLIIVGIIFYLYPSASTVFIGILLGLLFIVNGLSQTLSYFQRRKIPLFKWHLYYGIISMILGLITILNPFTFTKVATVFVGIWLIYIAFVKGELSLRLKLISEKSWLFLTISTVLSLFMGIVLLVNPFNNLLLTEVIGSFLILYGVLDISDIFMLKKRAGIFLENL